MVGWFKIVQINVCNSSNPQSLGGRGFAHLDPLLGLCPGPAGDFKRSPDPSPTHAPPPPPYPKSWIRPC